MMILSNRFLSRALIILLGSTILVGCLGRSKKVIWANVDRPAATLAGTETTLTIEFQPVIISPDDSSFIVWENHNITEMEVCEQPCTLTGKWTPFVPAFKCTVRVPYVGEQDLDCNLRAKFRTTDGEILYASVNDGAFDWEENLNVRTRGTGTYDPRAPVNVFPSPEQTKAAAAIIQAAFAHDHVTGSIQINGQNQGTIGALAHSTIDIVVSFQATSPFADITEMRIYNGGYGGYPITDVNGVTTCAGGEEIMNQSQWEPLMPAKTYPVAISINWQAFSLAVQYRDRLGNISPVYCDTLQIEGSEATTP